MFDRFNVLVLVRDHTRSLVIYPTTNPDRVARFLLYILPLVAAGAAVSARYRIGEPTALVPATSLLAGIFFAAVGQLISIRARIADSVHLSGNQRLRAHFRESVSGMLLAALAALGVSLLLGVLILLAPTPVPKKGALSDDIIEWTAIACSALVVALITYMVLLFVSSARRLYTSYLEAFEGGLPLPKRSRLSKKSEVAMADGDTEDEEQDGGDRAAVSGSSRLGQSL